jgi:hypothetical protein
MRLAMTANPELMVRSISSVSSSTPSSAVTAMHLPDRVA